MSLPQCSERNGHCCSRLFAQAGSTLETPQRVSTSTIGASAAIATSRIQAEERARLREWERAQEEQFGTSTAVVGPRVASSSAGLGRQAIARLLGQRSDTTQ